MRIAYLAHSTIPSRAANSVNVMQMCNAFAKLGHDVTLFTPSRPEVESGGDPFAFYGVSQGFRIHKIRWPGRGPLRPHRYALQAVLLAKAAKPDLVYGRCLHSCSLAALLGMPVVFEAHDPLSPNAGLAARHMHLRSLAKPNLLRLVANSEGTAASFRAHPELTGNRILVAPNGAVPPPETVQPAFGSNGRLQVGYIGQLYAGRGVELIEELARQLPDLDFHVIGGREEDVDKWRQRTSDLPNLTFHGFVRPSETASYRAACDVLLAPYGRQVAIWGSERHGRNTAAWMSPVKLFEYMSSGKAIVASRLPAITTILDDGKTALLCAPDELREWRDALIILRDRPALRTDLGQRASARFRQSYTWDARARRVLRGLPP